MRSLKKAMALALALLMVMAIFAGCGTAPAATSAPSTTPEASAAPSEAATTSPAPAVENIALKVWTPQEEQDLTVQLTEAFAEAHPEYKITFDYGIMGVDKSIDALKADATVAADVFLYPSGGISELVQAGLIYPITVDADQIKSLHGQAAIKSTSLNGQLYGVPETPNSWFMYYNKSMYTPDDVKSLETMMAKDLGADVKNFSTSIDNSWYMSAFFYAAGGTLFGPDGTDPTNCSWNDATGLKVGKYLIDLAKNPKYVNDKDGLAGQLMSEGKLAALTSGTWSADSIKKALGDNYAAVELPTIKIDGTDYQLKNFADFKAFGVNANTKYPKAAQQLAAWLGNADSQKLRFEKLNTAPTVTSLISDPAVVAKQEISALSQQTQFSISMPPIPKLNDYWTPAGAFGAGIVNGDITEANLQESLDAMVNAITTTLKK